MAVLGMIDSVADALTKLHDFIEKDQTGIGKALEAIPGVKTVGASAYLVGALTKIITSSSDGKENPLGINELGMLACTMAWNSVAIEALSKYIVKDSEPSSITNWTLPKSKWKQAAKKLKTMSHPENTEFELFRYDIALIHPFMCRANDLLRSVLEECETPKDIQDGVITQIYDKFKNVLEYILTSTQTEAKFKPFKNHIENALSEEDRAKVAIDIHADYQCRQFEKDALFGQDPFTLKDIYINTECVVWKADEIWPYEEDMGHHQRNDIEGKKIGIDPFIEGQDRRAPLLDTVMGYITNKDRENQPIIIQGLPGHGKSSFTLRLCHELLKPESGFIPIRIRMRDLRLVGNIFDSISDALKLGDGDRALGNRYLKGAKITESLFLTPHSSYGDRLCRYVLILDGWDELEVGASARFQDKILQVLNIVDQKIVKNSDPKIKVVITGRPTDAVKASQLIKSATPILTMRYMHPSELKKFAKQLHNHTQRKFSDDEWGWKAPDIDLYSKVFNEYNQQYEQMKGQDHLLGIFGMPLLAYLAIRTIAEEIKTVSDLEKQKDILDELLSKSTNLYRSITNLTIKRAGKPTFGDTNKDEHKYMPRTDHLRKKLHYTAAAMSSIGREYISKEEWKNRLPDDILTDTSNDERDESLAKLMLSFYFKGGGNGGIEFTHKSFREYLFAEHIVERMKEYADRLKENMPERMTYRHNFADVRDDMARTLGEIFAPQTITEEVSEHLHLLIQSEILQSDKNNFVQQHGDDKTIIKLKLEDWKIIRNSLADIWQWWLDEVHMRPSAEKIQGKNPRKDIPPMISDWIDKVCVENQDDNTRYLNDSFTMVDARVGDGLFQLCCLAHHYVAVKEGWEAKYWSDGKRKVQESARYWQTIITNENKNWTLFRLSNESDSLLLFRVISRINATSEGGWLLDFPSGRFIGGADLNEANLIGANLSEANLIGANLSEANLNGAYLSVADLGGADLRGANLIRADLRGANLIRADLRGAYLIGADLRVTYLIGADLRGTYLIGADQIRDRAYYDKTTKFPEGKGFDYLRKNPRVPENWMI